MERLLVFKAGRIEKRCRCIVMGAFGRRENKIYFGRDNIQVCVIYRDALLCHLAERLTKTI